MVHGSKSRCRPGFTLLELLVVVSLIAILVGLTFYIMNGVTDQAQRDATRTTLAKINGLLQQRVESFDRAFAGSRRDESVQRALLVMHTAIQSQLGRAFPLETIEDEPAVAILAKKDEFRFQFPQRVEDRLGTRDPQATPEVATVTYPDLPASVFDAIVYPVARGQLITEGNGSPTREQVEERAAANWALHDRATESSELLYYALIESDTFGAGPSAADEFSSLELADTDGDGLPEFVDAWGQPLQFYRWPTRLFDPDAPVATAPSLDNPLDPTDVDPQPTVNDPTVSDKSHAAGEDNLRSVPQRERAVAGVLVKGLPPEPSVFGTGVQRDFLLVDPDDQFGVIYSLLENPSYSALGIDLSSIITESAFHTIDTYHVPLIVSAGVDGELGLYEPWRLETGIFGTLAQLDGTNLVSGPIVPADTTVDALRDNLTNGTGRAGGRR